MKNQLINFNDFITPTVLSRRKIQKRICYFIDKKHRDKEKHKTKSNDIINKIRIGLV